MLECLPEKLTNFYDFFCRMACCRHCHIWENILWRCWPQHGLTIWDARVHWPQRKHGRYSPHSLRWHRAFWWLRKSSSEWMPLWLWPSSRFNCSWTVLSPLDTWAMAWILPPISREPSLEWPTRCPPSVDGCPRSWSARWPRAMWVSNVPVFGSGDLMRSSSLLLANLRSVADRLWHPGCNLHPRFIGLLVHGQRWIAAVEQPTGEGSRASRHRRRCSAPEGERQRQWHSSCHQLIRQSGHRMTGRKILRYFWRKWKKWENYFKENGKWWKKNVQKFQMISDDKPVETCRQCRMFIAFCEQPLWLYLHNREINSQQISTFDAANDLQNRFQSDVRRLLKVKFVERASLLPSVWQFRFESKIGITFK